MDPKSMRKDRSFRIFQPRSSLSSSSSQANLSSGTSSNLTSPVPSNLNLPSSSSIPSPVSKTRTLLIISPSQPNYLPYFKDKRISYNNEKGESVEEGIQAYQANWDEITLVAYSDCKIDITLPPHDGTNQTLISPDFVLIRSVTHGLPGSDFRNLLYGLTFANISTLNSVQSVLMNSERSLMYSGLVSIANKLGQEKFPLIPINYYPNYNSIRMHLNRTKDSSDSRFHVPSETNPIIVKVGHVHDGFGKMLLNQPQHFEDLSSILAINKDYCTSEPFVNLKYDVRIQKIGNYYRVYDRELETQEWKGSSNKITERKLITENYKLWIDECSKLFGGMDILCVDVIKDDKVEYILEMNDLIRFNPQNEKEDIRLVCDLTIEKMQQAFSKKSVDKSDSSSFGLMKQNTRMEVEYINLKNENLELETNLKEAIDQNKELRTANVELKEFVTKSLRKMVYTGIVFGIPLGILISYLILRFRR